MASAEQAPIAAPAFAVVRRGYDPDQVAHHLNRVDTETTILAADRAAAVEQASQLNHQLLAARKDLDAARTEIEQLRAELRVLSGPPDTVESMNERLQVMLRLAKDEFTGMRAETSAHAAAHAADIIASVGVDGDEIGFGFDEAELRGPRDVGELERLRREAAEERARLDDDAANRRATEDEEFRQVLALRCREAMAQIAKLQTEAMRSARRVMDDADEQARTVLGDAKDAVKQTVEDAQREVDDLHKLRQHLATQLDTSRHLLNRAYPEARAAAVTLGTVPDPDADGGTATPAPTPAPMAAMPAAEPARHASAPARPAERQTAEQQVPDQQAPPQTTPAPAPAAEPVPAPTASSGQHHAEPSGQHHAPQNAPQNAPQDTPHHTPQHAQPALPIQPTMPALGTISVPQGWPVPPGSYSAWPGGEPARDTTRDTTPATEQTQPGLPDLGGTPESTDAHRAQPMRIAPREPDDVPGPARVPFEEQDPHIAPPRRYP